MSVIKGSVIQFLLSQVRTSTEALIGGKVYFYQPGTTITTGIKIWLDEEATSAANNPYTLDADATAQIYASGKYRIVIKDALGVTQFDRDNITFFDFDTPYEIDALQYSPNTFTQASITTALTAIGTTNKATLLLRPGAWAISTPLAIPANVTLSMPPGAYFTFSGTGVVTFSGTRYPGYLEWFGGSAAAAAAVNAVAIQQALNSGIPLSISTGTFQYDTPLVLHDNQSVIGLEKATSVLQYTGTGNGITGPAGVRTFRHRLQDFTLLTTNTSNVGIGINLAEYDSYYSIDNVQVVGFGGGGMLVTGLHNEIRHCNINGRSATNGGYTYGIRVQKSTTAALVPTTILLDHNYIAPLAGAATGIGIDWINAYKCEDTFNIIESSVTGRKVTGSNLTVISTYYEGNTTDQTWYNASGLVIGLEDPNVTATWDTGPVDYRLIRFINLLSTRGGVVGQSDVSGSQVVNGKLSILHGLSLGYDSVGDSNLAYDQPSQAAVQGFVPITGRFFTLPTAIGNAGLTITANKEIVYGGGITLTVLPTVGSGQTIAGTATYVLYGKEHLTVISDGANWQVISAGGVKQAAIADGEGAGELNKVKAALRAFGIIAQ